MSGKGETEEDIEAAKVEREEVKRAALEEGEGEDEEEGKINNEGREVEGHQTEENREGTEGGSQQGDQQRQQRQGRVVSDPISESYRSIVEVINRTSDGFREGKKWKCVAGTPIRPEQRPQQQQHFQYARPREQRKSHRRRSKGSSNAMTRSHTTEEGARGSGAKRLVRQTACAEEAQSASAGNVSSVESQQLLSAPPGVTAAHLRGRVSLPVRQWTVDASCPPALGQAYLLRPVSRGSIKSSASGGGGEDGGRRLSPSGDPQSSASAGRRSPRPERLRAASFNVETNDGGAAVSVRSSSRSGSGRTALSAARVRIKKQRTCDSAPMRGGGGRAQQGQGPAAAFGGSNRHLPRQFSNASAYSAAAASLIPTSLSQQGMTLVRGASCSLVDIPTYLGPSYGGVELAQICDVRTTGGAGSTAAAAALSTPSAPAAAALEESSGGAAVDLSQQRKSARPRLQVICWGGD